MEDAQGLNGNETQKANVIFHMPAGYRAADFGMATDIVTNHDQAKVRITRDAFQSRAGHGERLNEARDVLAAIDATGVQKVWIVNLVAIQNSATLAQRRFGQRRTARHRVVVRKHAVWGVVDQAEAIGCVGKKAGNGCLRGTGNSDDAGGPRQPAAQTEQARLMQGFNRIVIEDRTQVMDGDDVRLWQQQRDTVQRNVGELNAQTADEAGQSHVVPAGRIGGGITDEPETRWKPLKMLFIGRAVNEKKFVLGAGARKGVKQVPDVGTYAKIGDTPAIEGNFHGTGVRRHG